MKSFGHFYLDREKDIMVELYQQRERLFYVLSTPNHHTGNLISNLAKLCDLPVSYDDKGLRIIKGEIPSYIDGNNRQIYIFRLADTKIANIYPDGSVEMKASIPSISKTLMSQTKDFRLPAAKTIIKTYIRQDVKLTSDLHTHMNGNLSPDILIALGIYHQIRYPNYYIRKLELELNASQKRYMAKQRARVARQFADSQLTGKYLDRKIDDNTFINFADLILNNITHAQANMRKIRNSLAIMKDGQAVFTNLEKVYLYRYVFTKGVTSEKTILLNNIDRIKDADIRGAIFQMMNDHLSSQYGHNTLYQDCLLWIARTYQSQGIRYAEISDTTLVKRYQSVRMLEQVHEIMPAIEKETGVKLRFLAAIRRVPLNIIKDVQTPSDYLAENLMVLKGVAIDPYVAGCDFVGEEVNDIRELQPAINEIVRIARDVPDFVVRIHAGENDSLTDNMYNSIVCVRKALAKGQKMPHMRIGHGLYAPSLTSAKGRKLVRALIENNVVVEFQISSNVRLNNLSSLELHPLKKYLAAGVQCVMGTDGAALYGTGSIDEQLSLEKLLELSHDQLLTMKKTEDEILKKIYRSVSAKEKRFAQQLGSHTVTEIILDSMNHAPLELETRQDERADANVELQHQVAELPWDRMPITLMGGSFNNDRRKSRLTDQQKQLIDELLTGLDPQEYFFIIGHRLTGAEKYLVERNHKRFHIIAFVPGLISRSELYRIRRNPVKVRVSTENEGVSLYKSINYEVFERRPSILIGFDGNSAGANMMQEARNGKGKCRIFIYERCSFLKNKAATLEGYVRLFGASDDLTAMIKAE